MGFKLLLSFGFLFAFTKGEVDLTPDEVQALLEDEIKVFDESNIRIKREACVDTSQYCGAYKSYCSHNNYKDYLKKNCKKTCDFCPKPDCFDRVGYCDQIKSRCKDGSLVATMKYYCAKTCGYCAPPRPVAPTTPAPTAPRTEQPIDQGSVECGVRPLHTRIVGGVAAKPGTWPWQISIDYTGAKGKHWCGGSIVTPKWILTAAHCFAYSTESDKYTVVAGEHDLNGIEGYEQRPQIEKIINHPKYSSYNNHDYDVALIKVKTPFKYNSRVRPVCLPKFDFDEGSSCYISGWGHTQEGGDVPQFLRQAKVPLVSRKTCETGYSDLGYKISQRMRCAGFAKGGIDACQGDSGGPLVCEKNQRWYLMGDISWGVGCARKGRYGVYGDLFDLKYWVQETINKS